MGFVLILHVFVCILLVITILMQAGRGGGLAESFTSAESMFGTQTNTFLIRTSTVLAAIFLVTSLVLAISGAKGEKSLMANKVLLPTVKTTKPMAEESPVTIKVGPPKPMDDAKSGQKTLGVEMTKPLVNAAK